MSDTTLQLSSGFAFDYENLFGEGKVTAAEVQALAARTAAAHQAVVHMRATGEVKAHLSKDGTPEKVLFTQLPYVEPGHLNSPDSIARLKAFGASLRNKVDAVVSFGIGGSYLGNKVLFDVHCGEFWNQQSPEERHGWPKLYFSGNNLDPRRTGELLAQLEREARMKAQHHPSQLYRVCLVVISKSGSTIETTATFMTFYDALRRLTPPIEVQVVAVTDPANGPQETVLHRLARTHGWPTFSVPDGVGGRFSIFAEVGLVTAACIGFDIDEFLAGARSMDEVCRTEDLYKNPALLNATLKYLAAEKHGRRLEVFMPYADYLKSVSEWYIQLLAESLGKRTDRDGRTVYYGRTPIVAVGTTDMHAQTQQHQDGAKDKIVQFLRIKDWGKDITVPDVFPDETAVAKFAGIHLSAALEVARESNAEALAADGRFSAVFVLPELTAFHLGELLYLLALSVAYEGELANVDAFDQPGVEAYKKIMGPKIARLK
jgi:glucose-6-phosphate isomerase